METTNNIAQYIFNDDFIKERSKTDNVETFHFNFSPKIGRIIRIDKILNFTSILDLSLMGHNIENIEMLKSLKRLKKIDLSWNMITDITPLTGLCYLEDILISHNKIEKIPESINLLKNLRVFRISFNLLADRNEIYKFKKMINLADFDVEGCPISSIDDSLQFIIFVLPQLNILNNVKISVENREKSRIRFERSQINSLKLENDKSAKLIKELKSQIDDSKRQNLDLSKKLHETSGNLNILKIDNKKLKTTNNEQTELLKQKDMELALEKSNIKELKTQISKLSMTNSNKNETQLKNQFNQNPYINDASAISFNDTLLEEYKEIEQEKTILQRELTITKNELIKQTNDFNMAQKETALLKKELEKSKHYEEIITKLKNELVKTKNYQKYPNQNIIDELQSKINTLSLDNKTASTEIKKKDETISKLSIKNSIQENEIKILKEEIRKKQMVEFNNSFAEDSANKQKQIDLLKKSNKELKLKVRESEESFGLKEEKYIKLIAEKENFIRELNTKVQIIQKKCSEMQKQFNVLKSNIIQPKTKDETTKLNSLSNKSENTNDIENKLNNYQKELSSIKTENFKLKKNNDELQSVNEKLNQDIKFLNTKLLEFNNKIDDNNKLRSNILRIQKEQEFKKNNEKDKLGLETKYNNLKLKFNNLSKKVNEYQIIIEKSQTKISELTNKNKQLESDKNNIQEKLSKENESKKELIISKLKEDLLQTKELLNETQSKTLELANKLTNTEFIIKQNNKQIEEYQNQINYLESREESKNLQQNNELQLTIDKLRDELNTKTSENNHLKIDLLQTKRKIQFSDKSKENELTLKNKINNYETIVSSFHTYLQNHSYNIKDSKSFITKFFQKLAILFREFSLYPIEPQINNSEAVSSQSLSLLNDIRDTLLQFPINDSSSQPFSSLSLTEQIKHIKELVLDLTRIIKDKDTNLQRMRNLVSSQHLAVMELTKNQTASVLTQKNLK